MKVSTVSLFVALLLCAAVSTAQPDEGLTFGSLRDEVNDELDANVGDFFEFEEALDLDDAEFEAALAESSLAAEGPAEEPSASPLNEICNGGPCPVPGCSRERRTRLLFEQSDIFFIANAQGWRACCQLCQNSDFCASWTFNSRSGSCFLLEPAFLESVEDSRFSSGSTL